MRGEFVPADAYFTGNPVVPWVDAPALPESSFAAEAPAPATTAEGSPT